MSVYVCAGCGKRLDEPNHAPSCPMYREPPAPDFRDLARRLAEALEQRAQDHHAEFHGDGEWQKCAETECGFDRALLAAFAQADGQQGEKRER